MATTQVAEKKEKTKMTLTQYVSEMSASLSEVLVQNAEALPKDFNKQRFVLNCMAVIKDDPKKWQDIKKESIVGAFSKGAYLGLDFFNGECYCIPYGDTANFQTDYKGEVKLCKKYSKNPIKDIYAKNVREGDFFEEKIEDGQQTITFKPMPFSNNPIIGSFAVVLFQDGSMMYETMSKEEIESVKTNYSKVQNSKAWAKSPGEMYKKTVLRRLCKLIDLNFDNANQDVAFIEGGDFDKAKANEPVKADEPEVVATFTKAEVIEEPGEPIEDIPDDIAGEELPWN